MISKYINFNDYVEVIKTAEDKWTTEQIPALNVTCSFGSGRGRLSKPFYGLFNLETNVFILGSFFCVKLFEGSEVILSDNNILKLAENRSYSKCHKYWR